MKKLIIIQTVTPDYRNKFFQFLNHKLQNNFSIYRGSYYFEPSVETDSTIFFAKTLNNYFIFKNRFLFQTGPFWKQIIKNNIIVLEMNPRILSNWIILLVRRMFFMETVLWGHAWPRKGATSKSDKLRNLMRLLANKIIVYTQSQKQELELRMPNKKIYSAPNAIYKKNEMLTNNNLKTIKNIIYVGRLTKKKKPLIMVKAFEIALKKLSKNVNLLIIGDGEEKQNIIEYVNNNKIASRVYILGHIGSYDKLRELYHSSLVSLSPGYVGLSATQSLGFGVPMLVSRNENHSPEIESIKDGVNALFFETNSEKNLSDKLLEIFNNQYYWIKQRELICEDCKDKYSIESMAEPFINLLKHEA